jgi:site-specific DNA recombinase
MRVALYARYSDDVQNPRSIEDQFEVCRRHAAARGWEIVASFSDAAISGAAMANRPGLQTLLAAAGAGGFERVLVEHEDRIARNLEHQAHIFNRLKHLGVGIATLSSDRIGVLEVAVNGMMAELYLANLGQKTRRGMRANAERGRATGARMYGYRSRPGGDVEIVPAEAAIIVEIFERYAAGETARQIAAGLNHRRIPATFGGCWNASMINGNRKRGNGILWSELYAGVKVWNRLDVIKDPETGRRRPTVRPREDWKRTPVPELRIVRHDLWEAAQARKAIDGASHPSQVRGRRACLFGALLRCGQCGASYTAYRRGALICTGWRERGSAVCGNTRPVRRAEVERRALDGLATRLLAPEAVAAYVRAYHAAWAEETASRRRDRAPLDRRLGEIGRRIERCLDEIEEGHAARVRQRLASLEAEEIAIKAQLVQWDAEASAEPPIALHPAAASGYAAIVAELQAWLQTAADEAAAAPPARAFIDAVQGLVTKIEIHPEGPGINDPFRLQLHGDLSRFLSPIDATTPWRGKVVAGGGLEPPTCGL